MADHEESRTRLKAALSAMRRGDHTRARTLLIQLVSDDEHNEAAWLALSQVLEDPEDVRVALENVLTLNPAHAEARAQLNALDAGAALPPSPTRAAPPPPPAAAPPDDHWREVLGHTPKEIDDDIEDPLLCVYCARPTRQADRRCPHCGQTLVMAVRPSRDSEYLRFGLLMFGIYAALSLFTLAGPLMALSVGGRAGVRSMFQLIADFPGGEWILGPFLDWPEGLARVLAMVAGGRLAVLVAALAGLRLRWAVFFYFSLAVLVLDIALNVFLLANNYMGLATGAINVVFALAVLSLIGAAYQEFSVVWQRLLNRPDADQRTAAGFYQRGREYSKLGMWGLAVAQWRKSVGLAPKEGVYYKELGLAYARLKRYARSLRTLEEAARQAPKDRELPEIIELVRQQMAREGQDKARR